MSERTFSRIVKEFCDQINTDCESGSIEPHEAGFLKDLFRKAACELQAAAFEEVIESIQEKKKLVS